MSGIRLLVETTEVTAAIPLLPFVASAGLGYSAPDHLRAGRILADERT